MAILVQARPVGIEVPVALAAASEIGPLSLARMDKLTPIGVPQSNCKASDDERSESGEKPVVSIEHLNSAHPLSGEETDDFWTLLLSTLFALLGGYLTYALLKRWTK
jgi:hypothetical protein